MSSSSSIDSWGPAVGHVVRGAGLTCSCPGTGSAGRLSDVGGGVLLGPSWRGSVAASFRAHVGCRNSAVKYHGKE